MHSHRGHARTTDSRLTGLAPPDKPVVLVDDEISKSGETVHRLLSEFNGYLVTHGADNFKLSVRRNALCSVLCNDPARSRFRKALEVLDKDKSSVARTALDWYRKLYRIEAQARDLEPDECHAIRQSQAVPVWDEFIAWATRVFSEGVAHGRTTEALAYLLKHQEGLRAYCLDGTAADLQHQVRACGKNDRNHA